MSTPNRSDGFVFVGADRHAMLPFPIRIQELTARSRLMRGDFGSALQVLKSGGKVARKGWNGKGMWLMLQVPDAHSKMTLPYIYMSTVQGDLVPWLASQTDMLAEDWEQVG
jgi:hypothetical protein